VVADGVNGLLIEPRAPWAIAAALCTIAEDRAVLGRLSAASRATILAHYSISRLAAELCSVYAGLSARREGRNVARA
jgi:glycosyltransferase involved in cell wall biosynthesis